MKTMYQVQSRLTINDEWLDDHLPFDSEEDAIKILEDLEDMRADEEDEI